MKNTTTTTTVESDTKPTTTEAVDPMSFSFRLEQSVVSLHHAGGAEPDVDHIGSAERLQRGLAQG